MSAQVSAAVTPVAVTPARIEDAAEILAVQHAAYQLEADRYGVATLPPLDETLAELLADYATHALLVARAGAGDAGDVVGAVRALVTDGTAHIGRLAVRPDLHGHGIGRRLLNAIERTTAASATRYELFTGSRSERNLRLYRRAGYLPFRAERISDRVSLTYLEKPTRITGTG